MSIRPSGRQPGQARSLEIQRGFTKHAAGSVWIRCGDTQVLCTASLENRVPPFLKDRGQGWITAEYGMLPGATHERSPREAAKGKQSGRTQEIQRLIGRSLRAAVDLSALGERTITLDCDVLQADGGTRTAAITGAWVALHDAIHSLGEALDPQAVLQHQIAAVSVGIYQGTALLDLDYAEDCQAETDMNLVMNQAGDFIEVQGTAEGTAFSHGELLAMLDLGRQGIGQLLAGQRAAIAAGAA